MAHSKCLSCRARLERRFPDRFERISEQIREHIAGNDADRRRRLDTQGA